MGTGKGREEAMHSQDAVACNEVIAGKYDRPSSSDEYFAVGWPLNGPEMTKCRTCGHVWPSHGSDPKRVATNR
jgi:hypothetical protein